MKRYLISRAVYSCAIESFEWQKKRKIKWQHDQLLRFCRITYDKQDSRYDPMPLLPSNSSSSSSCLQIIKSLASSSTSLPSPYDPSYSSPQRCPAHGSGSAAGHFHKSLREIISFSCAVRLRLRICCCLPLLHPIPSLSLIRSFLSDLQSPFWQAKRAAHKSRRQWLKSPRYIFMATTAAPYATAIHNVGRPSLKREEQQHQHKVIVY